MGNGRSIITDDSMPRLEAKRKHGCRTYLHYNQGLPVDVRRNGVKPDTKGVCNHLTRHHKDLKKDPERLSTEFIVALIQRE